MFKIVPCNITLRLGFNAFNGIILLHEVLLHVGIFRRNLPVACAFLVCHSLVKLFFYFSFLSYLASSLATFSRRSVNISLSNMISIRKFSFCFSTSAKKQQDTWSSLPVREPQMIYFYIIVVSTLFLIIYSFKTHTIHMKIYTCNFWRLFDSYTMSSRLIWA